MNLPDIVCMNKGGGGGRRKESCASFAVISQKANVC